MSTVKTKIDQSTVLSFLQGYFDGSIKEIEFLKGGEMSQAFGFSFKERNLVIRINTSSRNFKKDLYAHNHFKNASIPIPDIIGIGKLNESYGYAISEKAMGLTVNTFSDEQYKKILPEFLSILNQIHTVGTEDTKGYGKWNQQGVANLATWKDFILAVGMHADISNLFNTSFLEKEVWDTIYTEIERLAEYCPEDRFLVHGDYGFDNVVSDGERITGVLDWAESMYGDFLYDIAWLSFWFRGKGFGPVIEDIYRNKGIINYEERLLCYKLRIGLSSLSFYAFSQQKDKYESTKGRTLNLLK
jgi:hygromycin-B 4-O-kinase